MCVLNLQIADKKVEELEATRDLSRIWLHVDMDAFYAAVETLVDPSLKGKPMAVGGLSMISTANYEVGMDSDFNNLAILHAVMGVDCTLKMVFFAGTEVWG